MSTYTFTYTRTHSITYLADAMRNVLREVIRESGLSPDKLMGSWELITRGIQAWIESGHLEKIVIEFFRPGSTSASARWDFPISHTGSGVDDDMWLDKNYLRQIIAKSAKPSPHDSYRILLQNKPDAPEVDGFEGCNYLSTDSLTAHSAGTVVATPHYTAGATYWR